MACPEGVRLGASPGALRDLVISLARHPDVVAFARALVQGAPRADRIARLATVFTFVGHLVDVPPPEAGTARDGVDLILALAGEEEGPAVILAALLQALGERASVERARGATFVRAEIVASDLPRLPPHADLIERRGHYYIPLDARAARSPLGRVRGVPFPGSGGGRARLVS